MFDSFMEIYGSISVRMGFKMQQCRYTHSFLRLSAQKQTANPNLLKTRKGSQICPQCVLLIDPLMHIFRGPAPRPGGSGSMFWPTVL